MKKKKKKNLQYYMNNIFLIFIGLLIVFIVIIMNSIKDERIAIMGSCGKEYMVIKNVAAKKTANVLCELNNRVEILINSFSQEASREASQDLNIERLKEEYQWHDLIEDRDETYTLGKGDKIYLCLRDTTTGNLFDISTLMFVLLHELTHLATNGWDTGKHREIFWKNNIILMNRARELGIYNPINYRLHPVQYCNGININNNPLFT